MLPGALSRVGHRQRIAGDKKQAGEKIPLAQIENTSLGESIENGNYRLLGGLNGKMKCMSPRLVLST